MERLLRRLDELPPGPVQERCLDELLRSTGEVEVHLFSQLMARALGGTRRAARLRRQAASIDDAVSALLSGKSADEALLVESRRHHAAARRMAYAAGRMAGAHPSWWNDAWRALRTEEAAQACAFLDGSALTFGDGAAPTDLGEALDDPHPEVSAAAWSAASVAGDETLWERLQTIVREPDAQARARVADSARRTELVRLLIGDSHPGVRGAAARQLKARGAFGEEERRALRNDAAAGSSALRRSALRALALGGAGEPADGTPLVHAVLDEGLERGPGASAASALAAWASGEAERRLLFGRATSQGDWLLALGYALGTGELAAPSAPEELEALRLHALRHLGDDASAAAAAAVLRLQPTAELFALFSPAVLSESELLVLSVLAPAAPPPQPQLVAPLLAWAADEGVPTEVRATALETIGFLAPHDPSLVRQIAALLDGDLGDVAYTAMARITERSAAGEE